jgi:hypothetical protein
VCAAAAWLISDEVFGFSVFNTEITENAESAEKRTRGKKSGIETKTEKKNEIEEEESEHERVHARRLWAAIHLRD